MQSRLMANGTHTGLLCLLSMALLSSGLAQNPPERPNILWHLGTFRTVFHDPNYTNYLPSLSFTEDSAYFVQSYGHAQVFHTDWAIDPNVPRGRALVSYQLGIYEPSFTDRDEQGREYVVGAGRLAEWVRNASAYGGGYLKPPTTFSVSNGQRSLVLRGNSGDRRLNRLVAVARTDGRVTVVRLDYDNPSNMNTQRVDVVAHTGAVTALAYDAASRTLFTGGTDGLIRSWTVGLSGNTPTLTPRQTVAAHRAPVKGLAYEYGVLISVADYEPSIKGWSVTNGALPATPTWQIEPPLTRSDNTPYVAPTGHPQIAAVFMYDGSLYGYWGGRSRHLYIERSSGRLLAEVTAGAAGLPVYSVAKNRWITNHSLVFSSVVPRAVSVAALASSHPVTALVEIGGAIVAGYANGELRSFNPNGSATGSHPNSRVIGLADVSQGGTRYVLSADVEGRLVISPVPIGAAVRSVASGLTSAVSMAVGADAASRLVAIAGHTSGQAEVKVFRLTWSGSTPSLTPLASFAPPSSDLSQLRISFVAANSPDLIVLSGSTLSRWNLSGSSYQRAYLVNLPGYPAADLATTANRVWVRFSRGVIHLYDAQTGARVLEQGSHGALQNEPGSPFAAHRLGSEDILVYASAVSDSLNDSLFTVAIAQEQAANDLDNPYLTPHLLFGFRVVVSDLPTALAVSGNGYVVGCRDGQVYEIPRSLPRMHAFAYDWNLGGYGGFFGLVGDRLLFSVNSQPPQPVSQWVSTSRLSLWSVSGRSPLFQTRLCSNTDCAVSEPPYRFTRPSPSNNYLYAFETQRSFARFTVWSMQGTPTQQYSLTETSGNQFIFRQWWMVPVDDQRVGFIYAWPVGTPVNNYQFFEVRLRFFQWSPTPGAVDVAIPINDMRLYDYAYYCGSANNPTCPQWGISMRWDLNANRRVAAVLGVHRPDPNNPNTSRRRIVLLYRSNPNSWASWTRTSILEEGVHFPSGVYPTLLRFHPTVPGVLYVGLSNGRLRIYQLDATGQITNATNPTELAPTRGNPGEVSAMDVANFTRGPYQYTAIVFGGANGLSVWVGFVCQPGWLNEAHFYTIDVDFPAGQINHIQVQQPNPTQPPVMVYSNGVVLSAARLDNLPNLPCPEDVNRDGTVDDRDVLDVLFAFGGPGFNRADVNCDGIVDDADLLLVLLTFGTCR